MRRVVHHIDSDALLTSVGLQPVVVGAVGALPDLSEHVGQHCEGACPEIELETIWRARHLEAILNDAFLVLHVPGEQNKHILDVGCGQVPNPEITLDAVGLRQEYSHPSNHEDLPSHLAHCRDSLTKNRRDFVFLDFLQHQWVRIDLAELVLERYKDELAWVFLQKLNHIFEHWAKLRDFERSMVD